MITFQTEKWDDYYRDCQELWKEHYEEIAVQKDKMKLSPDVETYKIIESKGQLLIVTMRDEGKMIGYSLIIVRSHLHYSQVLCAFEDAYFMSATYRKGRAGIGLIKETLNIVKKMGVQKAFFFTKEFKDLGKIFEYLGGKKSDIIYAFWIGE